MQEEENVLLAYVPKYNMPKGLNQLKSFSPTAQAKFYNKYLYQLNDLSIYVLILKKVLYRLGSFGAIPDPVIKNTMASIGSFEKENLKVTGEFRKVLFETNYNSTQTVIQKMVNLIGIQGDNCQATFHHRFIMSSKNPVMLADIALQIIETLENKPFLPAEEAVILKTYIKEFILELLDSLPNSY